MRLTLVDQIQRTFVGKPAALPHAVSYDRLCSSSPPTSQTDLALRTCTGRTVLLPDESERARRSVRDRDLQEFLVTVVCTGREGDACLRQHEAKESSACRSHRIAVFPNEKKTTHTSTQGNRKTRRGRARPYNRQRPSTKAKKIVWMRDEKKREKEVGYQLCAADQQRLK